MRLIDADALTFTHDYVTADGEPCITKAVIDHAPTVDAVPVVRCKDCKRWDEVTQVCDKFSNPHCAHLTGATGFCKWAERKDDD